jgi:hypothetical protein
METATSHPCLEKPAISPNIEPDESSSHPLNLFLSVLADPRIIFNDDKSTSSFSQNLERT